MIKSKTFFTNQLLDWNKSNNQRSMPWKGEKDTYKIWLSEIILQQTRVEQGWAYYEKFISNFPTIQKLAKAKDEVVFKLWEGLGYYSRCRNLLFTARFIVNEYKGFFPDSYENILKLKGIGPYTAAAIASFAFNKPHAVLDGNVYRILARFFGISTAIDSNEGKKEFTNLANELIDKKTPAIYNQAIMDFGATVCKPQLPLCKTCFLQKQCHAFKTQSTAAFPVKGKKLVVKKRWLNYIVLTYKNQVLVKKRTAKDIWQDLHEFLLIETRTAPEFTNSSIKKILKENWQIKDANIITISSLFKQQLTHQLIQGNFISVELGSLPAMLKNENWVSKNQLSTISFPKFIQQYLQTHTQQLQFL